MIILTKTLINIVTIDRGLLYNVHREKLIINRIMRTYKQVIMVFKSPNMFKHAVDILLAMNIKFNAWTNQKYIRISQGALKKRALLC